MSNPTHGIPYNTKLQLYAEQGKGAITIIVCLVWSSVLLTHHTPCCTTMLRSGGFNGVSRLSTCEKWNAQRNSWTPIAEMYSPRSNYAIEVCYVRTNIQVKPTICIYGM